MFGVISSELASRLTNVREFVAVQDVPSLTPAQSASCRGLAFVNLYAVYEYAVCAAVQATLSSLRKDPLAIKQLRRELLTLVLEPHWQSAGTSGRERLWDARLSLVGQLSSAEPVSTLPDDLFPSDGSHYRVRQLRTIWRIFGISNPVVPDPRYQGRIEELVENRNAISHGRRTAEDVGRRYSKTDIEQRVTDTAAICNYLLATMQAHYLSGALVA